MSQNNLHATSVRIETPLQIDYSNAASIGNPKTLTRKTWIIDIGASCHIVNSLENFKNIKLVSNWNVVLPNEVQIAVTKIGDFVLLII